MTPADAQGSRDAWHGAEPRGLVGAVRRLRKGDPTPEDRLYEVIGEYRRELDEQARRFQETLADLERREQLLSDSRASVERLLRLGTTDLDAREADLARLVAELTDREARLREEEADLARRRSELGAVELKRLAVERRERSLDAREERIAAQERELDASADAEPSGPTERVGLAFVPGARYALVELEPRPLARGDRLALNGTEHVVARVGTSPLPGDARRCAYLLP